MPRSRENKGGEMDTMCSKGTFARAGKYVPTATRISRCKCMDAFHHGHDRHYALKW